MKRLLPLCTTLLVSCSAEPRTFECHRAADCQDELCVAGRCRPPGTDASATDAGLADAATLAAPLVRGPCANAVPVEPGHVTLNEVLANVPAGPAGDANGDGLRDPYEDEFVEIVSIVPFPVDLRGLRITYNGKVRYTFEPTCLLPAEAVVVFGGGSVGASVTGSAIISETRLSLSNDGGEVGLLTPSGALADQVVYEHTRASSLTRSPQLFGVDWSQHDEVSSNLFSPGRCARGASFARHCVEEADMGSEQ